jgi:hypothetical protein
MSEEEASNIKKISIQSLYSTIQEMKQADID